MNHPEKMKPGDEKKFPDDYKLISIEKDKSDEEYKGTSYNSTPDEDMRAVLDSIRKETSRLDTRKLVNKGTLYRKTVYLPMILDME